MKISVDALEKERDFYFNKLRDIELIVQERLGGPEDEEEPPAEGERAEGKEELTLKKIQEILYSTEDGFEVPEGEVSGVSFSEGRLALLGLTCISNPAQDELLDETETF